MKIARSKGSSVIPGEVPPVFTAAKVDPINDRNHPRSLFSAGLLEKMHHCTDDPDQTEGKGECWEPPSDLTIEPPAQQATPKYDPCHGDPESGVAQVVACAFQHLLAPVVPFLAHPWDPRRNTMVMRAVLKPRYAR